MALKYAEYFQLAKFNAYETNALPLMKLSNLNDTVRFITLPIEGVYTANTGSQMAIQVLKRVKRIASPTVETDGLATQWIKTIDGASKLEWDTIEIKRVGEYQIALKHPKDAEWDLEDVNEAYGKALADTTLNTMFSAEENATNTVWSTGKWFGGSATEVTLDLTDLSTDTKRLAVVNKILVELRRASLFVDAYKVFCKPIAIIHPYLADAFSQLYGIDYIKATPDLFPQGVGQAFTYNDFTFYVSPFLNQLSGPAPTTGDANRAGIIVMTNDAYANSGFGATADITPFSETFAGSTVSGHKYGYLEAIIFPERISIATVKLPPELVISAKVND